jgi:hypothetical protein
VWWKGCSYVELAAAMTLGAPAANTMEAQRMAGKIWTIVRYKNDYVGLEVRVKSDRYPVPFKFVSD